MNIEFEPEDHTPYIKEHVFDLINHDVHLAMAPALVFDSDISWRKDAAYNIYHMIFRMMIPGKSHDLKTEKVPHGWFDHLLHDHPKLQRWLRRKPTYKKIQISETRVCPHLDISGMSKAGHHFKWIEAGIPAAGYDLNIP